MTTYLLFDTSVRSPELRHEIALSTPDPIVFLEHDGRRIVAGPPLEEQTIAQRGEVDEFWSFADLGIDEVIGDDSVPTHLIASEMVLRTIERLGAKAVVVPGSFVVIAADLLRRRGIEVVVDPEAWSVRRRRKTMVELEGIERAQRAADNAMLVASRILREAEPTADGRLRFEGEIITVGLIRDAVIADLAVQGAECDELIVQSGDDALLGHGSGSGPVLPNQSCIIDIFPRDRTTGAFSDMTRTFVPGRPSKELRRCYDDVRAAFEVALDAVKPGADDLFVRVAELFEERGHPTQLSSEMPLESGFTHGLGHGVGLEVHERPSLGRRSDPLVAGDVITIEPGLYYKGVGGVRIEDTVLVTKSGARPFTEPLPYELEP